MREARGAAQVTIPHYFLNGLRKWDSTTNSIFDVNNNNYNNKGSGQTGLGGGADYVGAPFVPINATRGWTVYE